jgi:hypothetical protein
MGDYIAVNGRNGVTYKRRGQLVGADGASGTNHSDEADGANGTNGVVGADGDVGDVGSLVGAVGDVPTMPFVNTDRSNRHENVPRELPRAIAMAHETTVSETRDFQQPKMSTPHFTHEEYLEEKNRRRRRFTDKEWSDYHRGLSPNMIINTDRENAASSRHDRPPDKHGILREYGNISEGSLTNILLVLLIGSVLYLSTKMNNKERK